MFLKHKLISNSSFTQKYRDWPADSEPWLIAAAYSLVQITEDGDGHQDKWMNSYAHWIYHFKDYFSLCFSMWMPTSVLLKVLEMLCVVDYLCCDLPHATDLEEHALSFMQLYYLARLFHSQMKHSIWCIWVAFLLVLVPILLGHHRCSNFGCRYFNDNSIFSYFSFICTASIDNRYWRLDIIIV